MIKFLHTSDWHLNSKITHSKTSIIKEDIKFYTLKRINYLLNYCVEKNIRYMFLCGDIFDRSDISKEVISFFKNILKTYYNITFYYILGNHERDIVLDEFLSFSNFICFLFDFKQIRLNNNIVISGISFSNTNKLSLYSKIQLNSKDINILLMHGEIGYKKELDQIDINSLSNVNYLALGHIHKPEISKKNNILYSYPGIPTGRSFDEDGIKGFNLVEVSNVIDVKFVPILGFNFSILDYKIDSSLSNYMLIDKIEIYLKDNDLLNNKVIRLKLLGSIDYNNNYDFEYILDKVKKDLNLLYLEFEYLYKYNHINTNTILENELIDIINNNYSNNIYKDEIISLCIKIINGEYRD